MTYRPTESTVLKPELKPAVSWAIKTDAQTVDPWARSSIPKGGSVFQMDFLSLVDQHDLCLRFCIINEKDI